MTNATETTNANSVFEQPWWLDTVAKDRWHEAVVRDGNGAVVARLPYVVNGGRIAMPRYTQTLGIWLAPSVREVQRGNDQFALQKSVVHDLLQQFPKSKSVDLVLDSSFGYVLPFRWEGYRIEPTFSYRITDLSDLDRVAQAYSKNIKRDINRGGKSLVLDTSADSLGDFITLQNLTYERQHRKNPIDNGFTEEVVQRALDCSRGQLLIARDESGKAHAGCFLIYDGNVCYLIMSGQDTAFGNDGAMPFLLDNCIRFAATVSRAFDFEGSMIEGIEQVYRRYGGRQVINWHVSKQDLIADLKDVLKPRVKRLIGYKI